MIEILGKNGAGKSYLANKLYGMGFKRSVNFTTRPKREGEVNGVDYFFIDNEEFERLIQQGFFVEYKERNGKYYGTPKDNISPQTILVAGDSSKFKHLIKDEIIPIFVNTSLPVRFERVKARNNGKQDLFERFHTENFLYLNNFNGLFIDNDKNDEASLNAMLEQINQNGGVNDVSKLKSNHEFIREWLDDFDQFNLHKHKDPMLMFLAYEEFVMRKATQMFKMTNPENEVFVQNFYMRQMSEFMRTYGMKFETREDEGFTVCFDGEPFKANFESEKLQRMYMEK